MTQTVTNVTLLTLAIGAITNGLNSLNINLLAASISIVAGIILVVVYEKYPTTSTMPPAVPASSEVPVAPETPTLVN